jgi:hypothetical protein
MSARATQRPLGCRIYDRRLTHPCRYSIDRLREWGSPYRQDRPPAAFCGVGSRAPATPTSREFFTVDLRGLRAALSARAAATGATESDVLRSALVAALHDASDVPRGPTSSASAPSPSPLKLSTRLPRAAAERLDCQARAAGLSRGAYLTRLIDGAPPVVASTDKAAYAAALSASAAELALLSRDITRLTLLLRQGDLESAKQYRHLLDTLDDDVRAHLDLAAAVLTDLAPRRTARRHPLAPRRSTP